MASPISDTLKRTATQIEAPNSCEIVDTKIQKLNDVSRGVIEKAERLSTIMQKSLLESGADSIDSSHLSPTNMIRQLTYLPQKLGTLSNQEIENYYRQIRTNALEITKEVHNSPAEAIYFKRIQDEKLIRPLIVNKKGDFYAVFKKHEKSRCEDPEGLIDPLLGMGKFKKVWNAFKLNAHPTAAAFITPRYPNTIDNEQAAKLNQALKIESDLMHKFSDESVWGVEYESKRGVPHAGLVTRKYDCDFFAFIAESDQERSISEIIHFIKQIAIQLKKVHDAGYVHNDLKPENILIDTINKKAIISDWDAITESNTYSYKGTPEYLPPEKIYNLPVNDLSDIWSLGLVFFFALYTDIQLQESGNPMLILLNRLEQDDDILNALKEIFLKLHSGWVDSYKVVKDKSHIPLDLKNLLIQMVDPQAINRPPIGEVIDRLDKVSKQIELKNAVAKLEEIFQKIAPEWTGGEKIPPATHEREQDALRNLLQEILQPEKRPGILEVKQRLNEIYNNLNNSNLKK